MIGRNGHFHNFHNIHNIHQDIMKMMVVDTKWHLTVGNRRLSNVPNSSSVKGLSFKKVIIWEQGDMTKIVIAELLVKLKTN